MFHKVTWTICHIVIKQYMGNPQAISPYMDTIHSSLTLHHSICHSLHPSVSLLRLPCCFLVNPPWMTWMACQSAQFPKQVSVPDLNCARCITWTCPTPQQTAGVASCPGAWPLHHPYTLPNHHTFHLTSCIHIFSTVSSVDLSVICLCLLHFVLCYCMDC